MQFLYEPKGTCSSLIEMTVDDGKIENVQFTGGCPGNLTAISKLVQGMEVDDAIRQLDGIMCDDKPTSCADQLAQALKATK